MAKLPNRIDRIPEFSGNATRRGQREFGRTVRLQAIAWQIGKDQGVGRAEAWKRAEAHLAAKES